MSQNSASVYEIDFEEWGINTNQEEAEKTTQAFNDAIQYASRNGYDVVKIRSGRFLIDPVSKFGSKPEYGGGIRAVSDIKLKMSKKARFYALPNNATGYSVFSIEQVENFEIEGGFIMGDRDEHDYSPKPENRETHEWGYCIHVRGSKNISIDKVYCTHATGDNIWVAAYGMMNWSGVYIPSRAVTITKCVLEKARRNNFATNGCEGLLFENNDVNYAGGDTIGPQLGVDLEGYGQNGIKYDHPYQLIVNKNRFKENGRGAIRAFTAGEVIINRNFADNDISYGYGTDVSITENKIIRKPEQSAWAHGIDSIGQSSSETGNRAIVTDNTVIGFQNGITVRGKGALVANNTIERCSSVGIYVYLCEDALVQGNRIDSDCIHIRVHLSSDVKVCSNKTKGSTEDYGIVLDDVQDVVVNNNKIKGFGGIKCGTTIDTTLSDNIIDLTGSGRGILWQSKSDVDVIDNTIKNPSSYAIDGTAQDYTNTVTGNRVKNCTAFTAILLTGGKGHTVKDNIVQFKRAAKDGYGIFLNKTDSARVIGNDVQTLNGLPVTPICTEQSTNSRIANNTHNCGTIKPHDSDILEDNKPI